MVAEVPILAIMLLFNVYDINYIFQIILKYIYLYNNIITTRMFILYYNNIMCNGNPPPAVQYNFPGTHPSKLLKKNRLYNWCQPKSCSELKKKLCYIIIVLE